MKRLSIYFLCGSAAVLCLGCTGIVEPPDPPVPLPCCPPVYASEVKLARVCNFAEFHPSHGTVGNLITIGLAEVYKDTTLFSVYLGEHRATIHSIEDDFWMDYSFPEDAPDAQCSNLCEYYSYLKVQVPEGLFPGAAHIRVKYGASEQQAECPFLVW